jgi:hypothetical protein
MFIMKKILFSALILQTGLLHAQYGYIALGYNGNYLSAENLDFVIDRYNETRVYLDDQMEYPHYLDGFDIHIGGGDKVLVDVGYTWRSAKVSASGVDASLTEQQRDLKFKFGAFDFGLGFNVINSGTVVSIGYNLTVGTEKYFSRLAPVGDVDKEDYDLIFKSFNPGGDVFIQFLFPFSDNNSLLIKPYYHFSYVVTDYAALNEALNPATASFDEPILESQLGGFGCSVMISVGRMD